MPAIQCPGCKAHISVPGLIDCPLCQTFLNPPFLRSAPGPFAASPAGGNSSAKAGKGATSAPRVAAASYKFTGKDWFNVTIVSAIVICILLIAYRVIVPSDDQVRSRKVSAALFNCQQRIVGLADYGGAEMPPYTKDYGKGDEFYFAWSTGSFHFKNGFGAQVPMSASCIGDLTSGQIKQLTLNGKDIL